MCPAIIKHLLNAKNKGDVIIQRGAVVEWLERLAVVQKVAGWSPARVKRLENSLCPPSSEWVPD